jgi:hypothetical protein
MLLDSYTKLDDSQRALFRNMSVCFCNKPDSRCPDCGGSGRFKGERFVPCHCKLKVSLKDEKSV